MSQPKTVLVFDPGESTGWVVGTSAKCLDGGTLPKDHVKVADIIEQLRPDHIVLERFNLYPSMARSLAWNTFYPCEVIGVIRYICAKLQIPITEQAPSVKKYAGNFLADWQQLKALRTRNVTEHTKDAYQHYRYFLRNHPGVLGGD